MNDQLIGPWSFTEAAKEVLCQAEQEASSWDHDSVYPRHVFLAILGSQDSRTAKILQRLGLDIAAVQRVVEAAFDPLDSNASAAAALRAHKRQAYDAELTRVISGITLKDLEDDSGVKSILTQLEEQFPVDTRSWSEEIRELLERSRAEAKNLGSDLIGVEHLLLGMLVEGEGGLRHMLGGMDLDLEGAHTAVIAFVAENAGPAAPL